MRGQEVIRIGVFPELDRDGNRLLGFLIRNKAFLCHSIQHVALPFSGPPGVKTLLTENLKTFGAYAKALELLITIEGGPMHLAAAVGTPLLALYGKTDPAVWYPWGVPFKALRQGRQENLITVDEVFREIQTFFDRHPSWGTDR